jgi:hypothetical protein
MACLAMMREIQQISVRETTDSLPRALIYFYELRQDSNKEPTFYEVANSMANAAASARPMPADNLHASTQPT